MVKNDFIKLYNGVKMPIIGFGTWQSESNDAYKSVLYALECGYRHIDTAYVYGNEKAVGKAIKDSKVPRHEIFLTTKCPADVKSYDGARKHFFESLKNLDVDYIDLYLIHAPWPWSNVGADCTSGNCEVWKAIVEFYNEGLIKSIGVSNFHIKDIEAITKYTNVPPMVNQIRYFIGNTQSQLTEYCQKHEIVIEAYSPLATGKLLDNPDLNNIARKYNVSIPKLCIRYCIEKNTVPLPKSIHKERIEENLDVDFRISSEDIKILDKIHNESLDKPLRS